MILDALLLLSDAQAVTTDAVSTNTVDSGAVLRHLGVGEPIGVGIVVDVAADFTTGDELYSFELIQSAAAALTSPIILGLVTPLAAALTAGARIFMPMPETSGTASMRYYGLNYNTTGTTPTITVTAFICTQSMFSSVNVHHASGFTVS